MTILEQIRQFSDRFGKDIILQSTTWRYYRLGTGSPVLWLYRRIATSSARIYIFGKTGCPAYRHRPRLSPCEDIAEFIAAFDAIMQTEGITNFALGGQSYGGMLAQAYLAQRGKLSRG